MSDSEKELFSKEDKIKYFDTIAGKFYKKNFGSFSKSDFDLLMFRFYMEAMIRKHKDSEKSTIDYSACSDYKIAKQLGITPQRVRNLKVKKELIYPQEDFNWIESLAKLLSDGKNVRIENEHIIVNIPDPNLFYEIQEYIEDIGGFIDIRLNPKILDMRQEYYLALAVLMDDGNREKIEKSLNEMIIANNENLPVRKMSTLEKVKTISEIAVNFSGAISDIADILSPGNIIIDCLKKLIEVVGKEVFK